MMEKVERILLVRAKCENVMKIVSLWDSMCTVADMCVDVLLITN